MSLHLVSNDAPLDTPSAHAVLSALPFAAYTIDADGRITAFNRAAAELWGRTPHLGDDFWCGSHRLYWPDGQTMRHDECPMAQTLKTGVPVHGIRAILERPDGSRIHFQPYPSLLRDADGRITGGMNVLMDISDRLQTEAASGHFKALVDSSDDAIISKGLDGVIRSWNQGAQRMFGYSAEEAIGRHVSLLIPAERQNEEPGIIERIRRGERVDHYETVRRRKDGSLVDISLTVSPIKNEAGQVIGASKIARDIVARKQAEAVQRLLLQEIKHRVKNTLGMVQAIATQTFREAPKSERDAFAGRLRALSNAHDLLTQQALDQVSVHDTVQRALAPFQENRTERFQVSGEDVMLDANPALLLAMAIHELATNAVKYGALSNAEGTVTLDWGIKPSECRRKLCLTWHENGGPEVLPPTRMGFGSTLIERALQQEQGRSCFEYRPAGVVCSLEVKL